MALAITPSSSGSRVPASPLLQLGAMPPPALSLSSGPSARRPFLPAPPVFPARLRRCLCTLRARAVRPCSTHHRPGQHWRYSGTPRRAAAPSAAGKDCGNCSQFLCILGLAPGYSPGSPGPRSAPAAGFYTAVNRRISLGLSNKKATRARISMMSIGTPRVPYRTPGEGTWQWLDIWNALYRERIIFIGDNIDEEFSNQVLASMLYLDSIDNSKKIMLYINGPGGDLTPCMALYDTMLSLKSPIGTHCLGFAFNLAGFILAAGEKGSRTGMPLCRISLQSPAGAARGQADDIENEANELIRIKNYLYGKLAEHTGHSVEKIHEDLSRVKRFDAEGALEYGIIDRIIRPSRIKKEGSTAQRRDMRNLGLG